MWKLIPSIAAAAMFSLTLGLVGCEDDAGDDLERDLENMGEQVEEGLNDAGRSIEDATD
jgi:hypothetical protein